MSKSRWNAQRTPIAFLLAPLAVPLIWTVYVASSAPNGSTSPGLAFQGFFLVFSISALCTYIGVIVFGVPIYLFLRAYGLTAFWIAPVVGFMAGALMLSIFGATPALMVGGPLGAVVGTILWLIARPDLRTHQHSPSGQGET